MAKEMTLEEHIKRHEMLHQHLDELVADFLTQTHGLPSKSSVLGLMEWSMLQCKEPLSRTSYVPSGPQLQPNDIVQVRPESQLGDKDGFFAGCLVVVEEVKQWGVQGYVSVPGERGTMPGRAYTRLPWGTFEFIGHSSLRVQEPVDGDGPPKSA